MIGLLERRPGQLRALASLGERRWTIDLDIQVRATIRLFGERLRRQEVTVRVEAPATGRLARVELRPENLRRILLLLLDNALLALARKSGGFVLVRVWTRADRAGFDVADNGPGIPPDRAEDVFLPHYTTRPGAAGMGLPIVREICRAHGGDATVLPAEGKTGATIRVEFRRKQARATPHD
jgi:signal transduction histidine kinase